MRAPCTLACLRRGRGLRGGRAVRGRIALSALGILERHVILDLGDDANQLIEAHAVQTRERDQVLGVWRALRPFLLGHRLARES